MENEKSETKSKVSRRDFLKYSAGVAAVAAGAAATLGKIPLPSPDTGKAPSTLSHSSEPMVVSVNGDELTLLTGHKEIKVKDPALASELASRAE